MKHDESLNELLLTTPLSAIVVIGPCMSMDNIETKNSDSVGFINVVISDIYPVHKGLVISPNVEHQVIKVSCSLDLIPQT